MARIIVITDDLDTRIKALASLEGTHDIRAASLSGPGARPPEFTDGPPDIAILDSGPFSWIFLSNSCILREMNWAY